jgi:hypothetical protein
MPANDIEIVHLRDMYGCCKTVKAYRFNGAKGYSEQIGDSYWSMSEGKWYVAACGYETIVPHDKAKSFHENLSAVELTLRLQISAADAIRDARAA